MNASRRSELVFVFGISPEKKYRRVVRGVQRSRCSPKSGRQKNVEKFDKEFSIRFTNHLYSRAARLATGTGVGEGEEGVNLLNFALSPAATAAVAEIWEAAAGVAGWPAVTADGIVRGEEGEEVGKIEILPFLPVEALKKTSAHTAGDTPRPYSLVGLRAEVLEWRRGIVALLLADE